VVLAELGPEPVWKQLTSVLDLTTIFANSLKGTVARDFEADFFIPIDNPDLGDNPLKG